MILASLRFGGSWVETVTYIRSLVEMMKFNSSMNGGIYRTYSSVEWDFYINRMCLVIMRNYLAAHVYLAACSSMRAYLVRLEEALAVADPEGVQGFVRNPLPRPQSLNISETKLFHFHGIFKQIDIKSAKRTPSSTELIPLPEILDPPLLRFIFVWASVYMHRLSLCELGHNNGSEVCASSECLGETVCLHGLVWAVTYIRYLI